MTIRDKAYNNLILTEAFSIQAKLIQQLEKRLDDITRDMKRFPVLESVQEYLKVSERLIKIKSTNQKDLLDINYDDVRDI